MVVTSGLRSEVRMRIMLVLLSGTVALYVAEAFLYYDPLEFRSVRPPEGFDQRELLEVVRDLRATGTSAFPSLA
jgi:hypothetical protein